jgi:hypothetical protein
MAAKVSAQTIQAAIRRAKLSIQAYLLAKNNTQLSPEEIAVMHADTVANIQIANDITANGSRARWASEMLIIPHTNLWMNSWYCEVRKNTDPLWSIDRMPRWARNGFIEPDVGFMIGTSSYTSAPKSRHD